MEECNKSYGANNHTSLLSHAQSQSQSPLFHMLFVILNGILLDLKLEIWLRMFKMARECHRLFVFGNNELLTVKNFFLRR